jgi:hypothetical protein
MPYPPSAYDLHQRQRWTRHDAHLWIRHDAARFYKPGTDPAEIYPTLKQQREAAEDAAFAAKIAASRRLLAALRAEVDEMKPHRRGGGWRKPSTARASRACLVEIPALVSGPPTAQAAA